jgi:outer membrane receptor for ferrienterochelin and colicin
MYWIHHYVTKFVSNWNIVESGVKRHKPNEIRIMAQVYNLLDMLNCLQKNNAAFLLLLLPYCDHRHLADYSVTLGVRMYWMS